MDVAPPIPKQTVGKTFAVSIALLGVIALTELGAAGWAFFSRYRVNSSSLVALDVSRPERPQAEPEKGLALNDTFTAPEAATTDLPKPTPVPQLTRESPGTGRVVELVEQGRTLRDRSDTSTALTRLREALTLSPDSALIISELAVTYEKMGQADKAAEQWRRIFDMGETAGIYYAAAEAKLKTRETAPSVAGPRPKDSDGFQPGSQLQLMEVAAADQPAVEGRKKMMLRIPVRARPKAKIDVRDVAVLVLFYDIIDDTNVVQTNASVNYHWTTLPADWGDDEIEILEVEYAQAAEESRQGLRPETRKYFGYVVRVYYKNELQDMRAEPVKLLRQFPPPLTLQTDAPK
jgi:tetratricopeptide (TPR) repeat protein